MKLEITEAKQDDGTIRGSEMAPEDYVVVVECDGDQSFIGRYVVKQHDGKVYDFISPNISWDTGAGIRVRLMKLGESWIFTRTE